MFGELLTYYPDLRAYHDLAIHTTWIVHIELFVVGLGLIEILKLGQFSCNGTRKRSRPIQPPDEHLCLVSLIIVGVEDN